MTEFDKMTQEEKVQAYVIYVLQVGSFRQAMSWDAWCEISHVAGYPYEEEMQEVL